MTSEKDDKIVEAIVYVQEILELLPPSSQEKALTEDEREGICFNVRTAVELLNEALYLMKDDEGERP